MIFRRTVSLIFVDDDIVFVSIFASTKPKVVSEVISDSTFVQSTYGVYVIKCSIQVVI
jgi:hypothetical protein